MQKFKFLPVDILSIVFMSINLLAITASWGRMQDPLLVFLPYSLITAMVFLLAYADRIISGISLVPGTRGFAVSLFYLIRQGYPVMVLGYIFMSVYKFQHLFFPIMLDPWFAAADQFLFGYQPSSVWMQRFDSFLVSEILHGAYFFYYVILGLLPLYLFFANRDGLNEFVFTAMMVYYASSIVYIILPVGGGRFDPEVMAMTETLRHGPFTRLMAVLYRGTSHFGAAFPSTHAGLSVVFALAAFRLKVPMRLLIAINGFLVLIATVYCGYHYFVDTLGGIVFALVFYPLGLWLYPRLELRFPRLFLARKDNPA